MNEKLLLHVCCAPCSTHPIEILKQQYDITMFFFNPNIYPDEEYAKRLNETIKISKMLNIPLLEIKEKENEWSKAIKGREKDREGGKRCNVCFKHRLDRTARLAKLKGCDAFTTTLTVSPFKSSTIINKAGKELEEQYGVRFIKSDFKKDDGFHKSIELSRKYSLYMQNYCGCLYSMPKA